MARYRIDAQGLTGEIESLTATWAAEKFAEIIHLDPMRGEVPLVATDVATNERFELTVKGEARVRYTATELRPAKKRRAK